MSHAVTVESFSGDGYMSIENGLSSSGGVSVRRCLGGRLGSRGLAEVGSPEEVSKENKVAEVHGEGPVHVEVGLFHVSITVPGARAHLLVDKDVHVHSKHHLQ